MELRQAALAALQIPDPQEKVAASLDLWACHAIYSIANHDLVANGPLPGQPPRPELRSHLDVPKRSPFTREGLAALLHAVTHIEFNAINLALDAVWRFSGMPQAYYFDWLCVAAEEATHFSLLGAHLQSMGFAYGDFPAHTGLWDMTHKTRHDVTARMALVPRTLEARGLDAKPPMQAKLRRVGSPEALRAVDILDVILRDEIGHVAIGNYWYRWLCERDGLEPVAHYALLTERYEAPRLRAPFNEADRRRAGFSEEELAALTGAAAGAQASRTSATGSLPKSGRSR